MGLNLRSRAAARHPPSIITVSPNLEASPITDIAVAKTMQPALASSDSLLSTVKSTPASPTCKLSPRNQISRQFSFPRVSRTGQSPMIVNEVCMAEQQFHVLEDLSQLKDEPRIIRSSDLVQRLARIPEDQET